MKRTRITDRISYLEPESMGNLKACSGLIVHGQRKIFLDVNMSLETNVPLLKTEQPDIAVITHYHFDHSAWLPQAVELAGAELYVPGAELPYLTSLDYSIEKTGGAFGLFETWKDFVLTMSGYRPVENPLPYGQDDSFFSDRSVRIETVSTPGHSPGHNSFYFPEEKILFCGDMGADRFGPWYGWADCDLKQFVESILRLMGLEVNLLLTSHGGMVEEGTLGVWNGCLAQIAERERKIESALCRGMTKAQIVEQGTYYPSVAHLREPKRTFIRMWEGAIFDQHKALLDEGGLGAFFPEMKTQRAVG